MRCSLRSNITSFQLCYTCSDAVFLLPKSTVALFRTHHLVYGMNLLMNFARLSKYIQSPSLSPPITHDSSSSSLSALMSSRSHTRSLLLHCRLNTCLILLCTAETVNQNDQRYTMSWTKLREAFKRSLNYCSAYRLHVSYLLDYLLNMYARNYM